jgi:hypothetical protein
MIFMQNDYPLCLLWWILFWVVWLGLCFFCHEKALESTKIRMGGSMRREGFCVFLCLFVAMTLQGVG